MSTYITATLSIALIYGLMGLGLNIQWGHTGLLNFGHVAFFAIGAYTSGLLALAGVPIWIGALAAIAASAVFALPVGWLTVRLKEDYLAIVTLALAEVVRIIFLNSAWSGGPSGLTGVPRLFSHIDRASRTWIWAILLVVVVVLAATVVRSITEAPFGRTLRAIRGDEIAVASLGKNVAAYKTQSFLLGAGLAGLAGSLYAHWIGYIAPDQFLPLITFYVWIGIILGGSSHVGAVLGTMILIASFEASRFATDLGAIPISATAMANLRLVLVGIGLVLLLRWRPEGIWPHRYRGETVAPAAAENHASPTAPGQTVHREGPDDAGN